MTLEEMWDAGTEWATDNVIEPVTDWVEDKVTDYKINQIKNDYVDSFKDAFVSHDKLTPELIEQGWKLGLDNVPYNASLVGIHDPGGIYYDPDYEDNLAAANAAATGGGAGGSTGTGSGSFLSQDLRQRTPSGTMYNPDISEYLNSGLFNYTGPGGVPEYTYGQGLRTDGADYGIWGTPTDVPNPYYWGQFGEGFEESTGVADGAISLPPVDLPAGVSPTNNNPNVGTNTTNINVGSGGGSGDKDLNYFETLAAMGIDPSDAPSTTFPGPNDKLIEEAIMNQDAVKETLPYESGITWNSGANEAGNIGQLNYTNDGTVSARDQALFNAAQSIRFPGNEDSSYDANGYRYDERTPLMEGALIDSSTDDSIFDYTGVPRNPNNPTLDVSYPYVPNDDYTSTALANSGLKWFDDTNNPGYMNKEYGDEYNQIEGGEWEARKNFENEGIWANDYNLGRPGDPSIQWVDTGNNYDTGSSLNDEYLGGEAYAQMVYNNDSFAESIEGLLGNSNDFNLGRPTDSNYVPFEPTYVPPQFTGGKVGITQMGDTVIDNPGYATELYSTGEIVDVNPVTGTYTSTGLFSDRPPGRW